MLVAKFRGGPSTVGYNIVPLPRVTGEDLNGGNGVVVYKTEFGRTSGGGKPCHEGIFVMTWDGEAAIPVLA